MCPWGHCSPLIPCHPHQKTPHSHFFIRFLVRTKTVFTSPYTTAAKTEYASGKYSVLPCSGQSRRNVKRFSAIADGFAVCSCCSYTNYCLSVGNHNDACNAKSTVRGKPFSELWPRTRGSTTSIPRLHIILYTYL